MEKKPTILALDLEGTLISNAMSQIPRPGLYDFLSRCRLLFARIVIFTTVNEDKYRQIARLLVRENFAPPWFEDIEYVEWHGSTKNLEFVPNSKPENIVLVDDYEQYIHRGQESQWIQIKQFDYPYQETDVGLAEVLENLESRLKYKVCAKIDDRSDSETANK